MIIIPGSTSNKLATNLAKELSISCASVEIKRFPDDEGYVRIDTDLNNETIVLIQNTYPDQRVIELFLLQDAIHEFNIKNSSPSFRITVMHGKIRNSIQERALVLEH